MELINRFEVTRLEDSFRRSSMASMDSAPAKASSVLEDQQSLLNSELMNEVFAIKCSNASRPSSGVQTGLRHRLPNNAGESGRVTDEAQKKCLLVDPADTTSKGDLKPSDGSFAKCMERFMSVCRLNMNIVLRRKHRRPAKSTKVVTPLRKTQVRLVQAWNHQLL